MTSNTPIITGLYVPGDRPERFDKAVVSGAQYLWHARTAQPERVHAL